MMRLPFPPLAKSPDWAVERAESTFPLLPTGFSAPSIRMMDANRSWGVRIVAGKLNQRPLGIGGGAKKDHEGLPGDPKSKAREA